VVIRHDTDGSSPVLAGCRGHRVNQLPSLKRAGHAWTPAALADDTLPRTELWFPLQGTHLYIVGSCDFSFIL
jgi:hypothetical protein